MHAFPHRILNMLSHCPVEGTWELLCLPEPQLAVCKMDTAVRFEEHVGEGPGAE